MSKAPKLSKAEKDYQKNVNKAIKQSYKSGVEFLGGQERSLQAFQPQIEEQIRTTFEAQVPQIQEQLRQQTVGIRGQQEETRAQRESALASARRQYQEGTQRTQALFGGVAGSSAGQAQSELLAREQTRQMGATQRQSQQNILGLEQNLQNVQAQTSQALRQVEQEKQNSLLRARDTFRQQLEQINSQRFQLAQDKSNKQLQALQDFNSRRRQLEDYYRQQQDSIANLRTQQQIGLETYGQQLQLAQRFTPQQITGGLSNLAGLSLQGLQFSNPQQAQAIAKQIAGSSPQVQQQYGATISPDGKSLQYVDTVTKQYGEIPLQ